MIKKLLASVALLGVSVSSFGYFSYSVTLQNATPFPLELTSLIAQQMTWHFPESINPNQTIDQSYDFWLSNTGSAFGNDGAVAVYAIQCPNGEIDQLTLRASVDPDWHFKDIESFLRLKAVLTGNHCAMLAAGNVQMITPQQQPNFTLMISQKVADNTVPGPSGESTPARGQNDSSHEPGLADHGCCD